MKRLTCFFRGHLWKLYSREGRFLVMRCERCRRKEVVL